MLRVKDWKGHNKGRGASGCGFRFGGPVVDSWPTKDILGVSSSCHMAFIPYTATTIKSPYNVHNPMHPYITLYKSYRILL